jgi:hypothetical protein
MSRPVLVFIHAPWETPALIDTALAGITSLHRTIIEEPAVVQEFGARVPAVPVAA